MRFKKCFARLGDLVIDDSGIARRGLLIRHLVMPHGMAGTRSITDWIATELSVDTYINIMAQYHPCGYAHDIPELAERPSEHDVAEAFRAAEDAGLTRLDQPQRRSWCF